VVIATIRLQRFGPSTAIVIRCAHCVTRSIVFLLSNAQLVRRCPILLNSMTWSVHGGLKGSWIVKRYPLFNCLCS